MPLRRMFIKVKGNRMVGVVKNFPTEEDYQEYKQYLYRRSKYGENYNLIYKAVTK